MLIHFANFISNFLRLSEHWPKDGSERVPSLKDLIENLAFYPLLSLFLAAISSAHASDGLALRLSATIFAVVVLFLLLATALQTLSMLLAITYGALRSLVPRDRVFQFPLISKVPADAPPLLSSATIWSPIPNEKEIGREEALFRGTDHRLPA